MRRLKFKQNKKENTSFIKHISKYKLRERFHNFHVKFISARAAECLRINLVGIIVIIAVCFSMFADALNKNPETVKYSFSNRVRYVVP